MEYLLGCLFIVSCILGFLLFRKNSETQSIVAEYEELELHSQELQAQLESCERQYKDIIDIDSAIQEKQTELSEVKSNVDFLRSDYAVKKKIYDELQAELALYNEQLELIQVGIYEPHFDFGTSEQYKEKIRQNKEQQKTLVQSNRAVLAGTSWSVNGSAKEGERMMKQALQLALRSFNNECDVIIANTTWKNVDKMEQRIFKAYEAINKFNKTNQITISENYVGLKIDELRLVYEHKLKIQEEKEVQSELRRQEREEEQLKKEAERALKEEQKLQELLDKVQQKAKQATGDELERLQNEILQLGDELREMQRQHDKVKAMAQQTKLGYVYVVSNIGSFGKDVYKIGMTRRLDPMDRIRELGDASVPFYFDVHAMIFSEDAPALEAQIQRAFADRRLNLVNYRKEFFNVSLDEIKQVVKQFNANVEFVDEVEAQEYTETLRLRNQSVQAVGGGLPDTL